MEKIKIALFVKGNIYCIGDFSVAKQDFSDVYPLSSEDDARFDLTGALIVEGDIIAGNMTVPAGMSIAGTGDIIAYGKSVGDATTYGETIDKPNPAAAFLNLV